jgi:hypothetical protein
VTAVAAGRIERELRELLGGNAVVEGTPRHYLVDETEGRGLHGRADAVVRPASAQDVCLNPGKKA